MVSYPRDMKITITLTVPCNTHFMHVAAGGKPAGEPPSARMQGQSQRGSVQD